MQRHLVLIPLLAAVLAAPVLAADTAPAAAKSATPATAIPKEEKSVTHGRVTVNGKTIHYTATAGTILLRDAKNQPTASMFYVAYTEDGVRNLAKRPVTFVYNGGPGSSTVWLLMGGMGPMRVMTQDHVPTPPPPYDINTNNPYTLLNKTDLVFIDAVGTGYSRPVGKGTDKMFWGVDQDVRSFGQFIQRYISDNNRWNSPKFLLGESYGTTRSANLADWLQQNGVALNGVVLLSSILNYGDGWPGTDLGEITYLPSYAAVAWYHHALPQQPAHLAPLVQQVEQFASTVYAHALFEGTRLPPAEYDQVVQKLHEYTGLSAKYIREVNLRINMMRFRAQLLRDRGRTIGRLDARFEGWNRDNAEEYPDYSAMSQAITPAYTAAFNWYVSNDLKFVSQRPYVILNDQTIRHWDWKHPVPGSFFPVPLPDVAPNLADALRKNPNLRVFSGNGYFDLGTPFYKTEYDFAHMKLPPALLKNVSFHFYHSGHMLYLHEHTLMDLHRDLSAFYSQVLSVH